MIMAVIMIKMMLRKDEAVGRFTTIMTLIMFMSTLLRMLTGDEVASDGSASILGHQLDLDRRTFLSQIGYCPQFDSIIPQVFWI